MRAHKYMKQLLTDIEEEISCNNIMNFTIRHQWLDHLGRKKKKIKEEVVFKDLTERENEQAGGVGGRKSRRSRLPAEQRTRCGA